MSSSTQPKLKDHVGILQDQFEILLTSMFESIGSIQRDAAAAPGTNEQQLKYENLPQIAEDIVKRVKTIDALIDEANKETCIGKDESEILESLREKTQEYEEDVASLTPKCEEANIRLERIRNMLKVIADHTPWMNHEQTNQDQI